jgi:hypothetical protein
VRQKSKPAEQEPEAPVLPTKVLVVRQHSFLDDTGRHRIWLGGQIVTDPADIALLIQRGATLEQLD